MTNKLNIFLSDNDYLSDFFPSKEKYSNILSDTDINNLKILKSNNKLYFSFFGIENHKVWRESFVPLTQQLKERNNLFDISANFFNYVPNIFQIYFCKENSIRLFINISKFNILQEVIDTLSIDNLRYININYYFSNSNISDINKIIEDFSDNEDINISFKSKGNLIKNNKDKILDILKSHKEDIINSKSKLLISNYAYYISLDFLSIDNEGLIKIPGDNSEIYISNNSLIYESSNYDDLCAVSSLIGKIEKEELRFKKQIKFNNNESNITLNNVSDFICKNNPLKEKKRVDSMILISNSLYSSLRFTQDNNLVRIYERMKTQIKDINSFIRPRLLNISYDPII